MVSISRKLLAAAFVAVPIAVILWIIGSIGVTIIPDLPAQAPLAFFAIGFGCVFGAALSEDVKASQIAENIQAPTDVAAIVRQTLTAVQQTQPPSAQPQAEPSPTRAP
jgi:hypothetical protein